MPTCYAPAHGEHIMTQATKLSEFPEDYWPTNETRAAVASMQTKVRIILDWVGTGRVVDVGCNDGALTSLIRSRGAWAVGLDRLRYVEIAKQIHGVPVIAADVRRGLPFSDHSFDFAVVSGVFEYMIEPASLLGELRRVLRPKGRLIVIVANKAGLLGAAVRFYQRWRLGSTVQPRLYKRQEFLSVLESSKFHSLSIANCPYVPGESTLERVLCSIERLLPAFATDFAYLCVTPDEPAA